MAVQENYGMSIGPKKLTISWTSDSIDRVKVAGVRDRLTLAKGVKSVRVTYGATSAVITARLEEPVDPQQKKQLVKEVELNLKGWLGIS